VSVEVLMQARNSYRQQSHHQQEVSSTGGPRVVLKTRRVIVSRRMIKKLRRPVAVVTALGLGAFVLPTAGGLRLYTLILSSITFILYGYDKAQARSHGWRVSENTLHMFEFFGGWPGALIGQHFFKHKTAKLSYQITFWLIFVVHRLFWWTIFKSGS
jgi:uncharacterized membrane protein YsdA (DUF1294 family)